MHRTYVAEKTAYQQRLEQYGRELGDWQQRRAEGRATRGQRPLASQEPVLPQVFTPDATLEALVALLEQNPRGLAFIQDELTGWVLAMNQYKGGKEADRQGWLSC